MMLYRVNWPTEISISNKQFRLNGISSSEDWRLRRQCRPFDSIHFVVRQCKSILSLDFCGISTLIEAIIIILHVEKKHKQHFVAINFAAMSTSVAVKWKIPFVSNWSMNETVEVMKRTAQQLRDFERNTFNTNGIDDEIVRLSHFRDNYSPLVCARWTLFGERINDNRFCWDEAEGASLGNTIILMYSARRSQRR